MEGAGGARAGLGLYPGTAAGEGEGLLGAPRGRASLTRTPTSSHPTVSLTRPQRLERPLPLAPGGPDRSRLAGSRPRAAQGGDQQGADGDRELPPRVLEGR